MTKNKILDEKRLIVLDPRKEYNNLLIIDNYNDFYYYMRENNKEFQLSIRFDNDEDFEFLFLTIFEIGNLLLVLEECEDYISPDNRSTSFLRLVKYGRHSNVRLLGIARRASELSRNFRSQVDKVTSFKQTDDMDLKVMEKFGLTGLDKLEKLDYTKNQIPIEDIHFKSIIL